MALVLERRIGEAVKVNGNLSVKVLRVRGNRVRLAFEAPPDVRILRDELCGQGESGKEAEHGQRRAG